MSTKKAPPAIQPPTRNRRRAQISSNDAKAIAGLVAKRLTIAESCECLGIRAKSFYQWKERHQNQAEFEGILTRVRGEYLRANLREMEKAAGGKDGVRHDWRAADRLNAIVSPERYLAQQQPQPERPRPAVSEATIQIWISAGYGQLADAPAAEIVDAPEVKALPSPPAELKIADGPGREDWNEPPPRPARKRMPPMFPSKLP